MHSDAFSKLAVGVLPAFRRAFLANMLFAGGIGLLPLPVFADSTLKRNSSWNWPDNAQVLIELDSYLNGKASKSTPPASPVTPPVSAAGASTTPSEANLPTANPSSPASAGRGNAELQSIRGWGLVERLVEIVSEYEPSIASLVRKSEQAVSANSHPELEAELNVVLANGGIPDRLKADMQLWVCRSFVQNALYDEAIDRLEQLPLESVSDPGTLLFNLAICQHHLLRKEDCLATLQKLLEREMDLPTRYAVTARLMQADIQPLEEDSLDEISRIMNDVERRLTLGRTGKVVQDKQQSIVDKLDKSIDKFEQQLKEQQQQQKQQQQQQQKQNSQAPSQPMQNQQFAEVKGDGEVNSKDLGNGSGWGNLAPAQRQEALQNMTKDLPSHYRDVIEAYFKRLATTKE